MENAMEKYTSIVDSGQPNGMLLARDSAVKVHDRSDVAYY